MVERIRMLLETRQLTPTQFADAIGIARPIVSHILSGRNKPSLEVVQRILAAMPDLSMPWLLNGTGPMQGTAASSTSVAEEPVPTSAAQLVDEPEPVVPAAMPKEAKTAVPAASRARGAAPAPPSRLPPASATPGLSKPMPRRFAPAAPKATPDSPPPVATPSRSSPAPVADVTAEAAAPSASRPALESIIAPEPAAAPAAPGVDPAAAALFVGAEKPIRRIVIFYRDGSFSDYQPE